MTTLLCSAYPRCLVANPAASIRRTLRAHITVHIIWYLTMPRLIILRPRYLRDDHRNRRTLQTSGTMHPGALDPRRLPTTNLLQTYHRTIRQPMRLSTRERPITRRFHL
jgi:hypothetical protein